VTSSRPRRRSKLLAGMVIFLMAVIFLHGAAAEPVFVSTDIPQVVDAGQPITVVVNITSQQPVMSVWLTLNPASPDYGYFQMNLTSGNETSGSWTYVIPARPWGGHIDYFITARDNSGDSSQYPASGTSGIEITGEEPPKQFPWNIVIIVVFLGVVLVLTEFIHKPGLYRPTGRERARKLEEEDRKREEEDMAKENTEKDY